MAGSPIFRRIQRELNNVRTSGTKTFKNIVVDDSNLLVWEGLIVPDKPPYNKGAFKIEIKFPPEFPFKPPTILFKTKIYHPNIDDKGKVCLSIINMNNWKPSTTMDMVIQALVSLVNEPEPEHPMRPELAEELLKDKTKFAKKAEEFAKNFGEKRPH